MSSLQSKKAFQPRHGTSGNPVVALAGNLLARLLAGVLIVLGPAVSARAVPVADLYMAQVPTDGLAAADLDAAYGRALDEVLVRVTGQGSLAMDAAQRRAIGPASALIRRYQPLPDGQLRVSFDPEAVRRRLDAARLPVWPADRPRTLILLPAAGPAAAAAQAMAATGPSGSDGPDPERSLLLEVAARRGVPVTISRALQPGSPTGADLSADPEVSTVQPELVAANADVLLIARPLPTAGTAAWRWTMVQGDGERAEWQGGLEAGVNGLADRLAARYAGTAQAGPPLRLEVLGVTSFDAYGRVQEYLRRVGAIQHLELARMDGDTLVYDVVVRGDARQLVDTFALQGVLEPVAPAATAETADLRYRLVAVR